MNQSTSPTARGSKETILIVEDDQMTRTAYFEILSVLNYRALVAANGTQALAIFEQHNDEIALVLSDLSMPQLGGMAFFKELRKMRPDIKILVCSGRECKDELTDASQVGVTGWLNKPVNLNQLAQAIAQALEAEDE